LFADEVIDAARLHVAASATCAGRSPTTTTVCPRRRARACTCKAVQ
jgi:hypothetical protein